MTDLSRALLALRTELQKAWINPAITIELAEEADARRLYDICAAAFGGDTGGLLLRYHGITFRWPTPDPARVFVDQEIGC